MNTLNTSWILKFRVFKMMNTQDLGIHVLWILHEYFKFSKAYETGGGALWAHATHVGTRIWNATYLGSRMCVLRCYSHTPPSPPSPLPVLVQLHPSTTSSTKCYSWIGFSDVPDSGSWQGRGYECLLNTQVLMNTQVGLVFIKTDEYSSSRYSLREYFQDLGIHIQVFSIHGTHEQTGFSLFLHEMPK